MLHISDLRKNSQQIIKLLKVKNFDAKNLINNVIEKDNNRKTLQQKSDELLSQQNQIAKKIGLFYKNGKSEEANDLKNSSIEIKKESQELLNQLNKIEGEIHEILVQIPNIPHESVPFGNSDEDNEILKEFGDKPKISDDSFPHWELAEKYDLIDFIS